MIEGLEESVQLSCSEEHSCTGNLKEEIERSKGGEGEEKEYWISSEVVRIEVQGMEERKAFIRGMSVLLYSQQVATTPHFSVQKNLNNERMESTSSNQTR